MTRPYGIGLLITLWLLGIALSGCQAQRSRPEIQDVNLVDTSYSSADGLLQNLNRPLDPARPIVVATFVNIDDLDDSSSLGRIVAEQTASRIVQRGYTVIELKLRENVFVQRQGGQFVLSREVRDISQSVDAQAVVAGTYAVGKEIVYVNARVIRTTDNVIMGAYDYSLPVGKNTRAMLRAGR